MLAGFTKTIRPNLYRRGTNERNTLNEAQKQHSRITHEEGSNQKRASKRDTDNAEQERQKRRMTKSKCIR